MENRLKLQALLEEILGNGRVYFQPPPSIKLSYPCIVYSLDRINTMKANDSKYNLRKGYQVTIMDKDPDSELPDKMINQRLCRMINSYPADGVNHWVFLIYT